MKSAKLRTWLVALLVVGVIFSIGFTKKAEGKVTARVEKAEEAVVTQQEQEKKPAKVLTDDEFVEYWAQIEYLGEKYEDNEAKQKEEFEKLLKKVGMTYEEFEKKLEAWSNEWAKKAESNPQTFLKAWNSLLEKQEKRLKELRTGK